MIPRRKKITELRSKKTKYFRILCLIIPLLFLVGASIITRIAFSADSIISSGKSTVHFVKSSATPESENTPPLSIPPQIPVLRIKITIGETRDVPFTNAANLIVVSPEIASAQIKTASLMAITGLKIGETILIISESGKRQTLIIEVAGKSSKLERQNLMPSENPASAYDKMSGTYDLLYVQGLDHRSSLVRNRLNVRRKLSNDRTMRFSGEIYKFLDNGSNQKEFSRLRDYGLDRISAGIDSPDRTMDFLDSQVRISPIITNGFEMRGFHLTSTPKISKNSDLSRKGFEVFAGLVKPTYNFYDNDRQKLIGVMIPVVSNDSWQLQAGFVSVTAPKNNQSGKGGSEIEVNGSYAPNKSFSADGQMAFAKGAISWGGRLNLKLKEFSAFGEISQVDKNSPLSGINGQSGGRRSESFLINWRPDHQLNISVNYNHTNFVRLAGSKFSDFNRSLFSVITSFRPNQKSRISFRFLDQQIETAVPGSSAKFQIATRTAAANYNIRFNQHLSNDFEARINFSREANAGSGLEKGYNLREQFRLRWETSSVTGLFNYTYRTPSMASLIIRNPQILPPVLQSAFSLNPAQFLQIYRDRFEYLLNGIELPQTRSMEAGFNFQTTVSKFTLTGETRYSAGEVYSKNQKNLYTSIGMIYRVDAANSFQINAGHSFDKAGGGSAITLGFTHSFGSDSGGGYQFSNFLGLNKGKVIGRVYFDLNGNGQDDLGEPGVPGLTVKLNEKRSVKTNSDGRYEFSANEGRYNVELISEDLGVRLRASTSTEQQILLSARKSISVSFGVSGYGFISGRIFNDALLTEEFKKSNLLGVNGVRLILHSLEIKSENIVTDQKSNNGGLFEFRNLQPGKYRLEIDSATLPAYFKQLGQNNSWEITVSPLQGAYLEIPLTAVRAVSGFIFIDKDGNGKFNPETDESVGGATITTGDNIVAVSDQKGAYILRNLSAGKIKITVTFPFGTNNTSAYYVELGTEPVTKRGINIAVNR